MENLDHHTHLEYLKRDVFMRERIETFIIGIKGACAVVAEHCGVPTTCIEEILKEHLAVYPPTPVPD